MERDIEYVLDTDRNREIFSTYSSVSFDPKIYLLDELKVFVTSLYAL